MNKARWQQLSSPGRALSTAAAQPPLHAHPSPAPGRPPDPIPRELQHRLELARGCYLLGQLPACAARIAELLVHAPELAEAHHLHGLALGRLGHTGAAAAALLRALEYGCTDPELPVSLVSAQLRMEADPFALEADSGPAGEMSGAAAWVRAQRRLAHGAVAEAPALFLAAARRFARCSPQPLAAERVRAAYLALAVAHLAAGQLDAAQQAHARCMPASGPGAPKLARQISELADALRGLPPSDRVAPIRALTTLVVGARLHVEFYVPGEPVVLSWENLPEPDDVAA